MTIQIGKTISHYKILEKLGEGGMGVVYKAEDLRLKSIIALKFLPKELTSDEEAKQRFIQEAKAARSIDHSNICTIFEIDETPIEQMFIAMRYYKGESLKTKIEKGPLETNDVVNIIIQILHGLEAAHKNNIVHRDIKPSNIMITDEGKVKIIDFGLARLTKSSDLTKSGTNLGTVEYMSPQQIRGEKVDNRADIWSFGVMLYEMLTGQKPFQGDHSIQISYSITMEEPEPVSKLRTDSPIELQNVTSKCLNKSPAKRHQSVSEILKDLEPLQSTPEKERKNPQFPKKWLFVGIGFLIIALIIIYLLIPINLQRFPLIHTNSIAVLPFENLSDDIKDKYFGDGITEDIIYNLSVIRDLKVISFSSVKNFIGDEQTNKEIGKELGVSTILKGTVRLEDDMVRVVAKLIDVINDEYLWVKSYDEKSIQILAIQSGIAKEIVKSIETEISPYEERRIEKWATNSFEAYDFYLKGRFHFNKRLPDGLRKGIDYYNQAIDIDSSFALAYSGLSDSYTLLGNYMIRPPYETYPKAKAAAKKALEYDSSLGEAHTSLAFAMFYSDWNWSEAEKEFKHGIELNPGNANAYSWYAIFLTALGRFDKATKERKRAQVLDPKSIVISADVGFQYYLEEKFDNTIEQCQKVLERDPLFHAAYIPMGAAYLQKSMFDEAISTFSKASMFSRGHPTITAALAYAYAISNRTEDAHMVLELLEERAREEYISPYWFAVIYQGLGDEEQTLLWLEKAYQEKDTPMVFLKVMPIFKNLHSNMRFKTLLKKMNLD